MYGSKEKGYVLGVLSQGLVGHVPAPCTGTQWTGKKEPFCFLNSF